MSRYAERTSVSVDRSRAEIEQVLQRYGATTFGYAWDRRTESWCHDCGAAPAKSCRERHDVVDEIREYAMLSFRLNERAIRLDVPMPTQREVGTKANLEGRSRERWRAIVLVVKAKLEAVHAGISTLEAEFLANVVTGDGRTLGQVILPRLSEAVQAGRLLPSAEGAG